MRCVAAAQQALEAGGARRLRNESFFSAPQLKRDLLGGNGLATSDFSLASHLPRGDVAPLPGANAALLSSFLAAVQRFVPRYACSQRPRGRPLQRLSQLRPEAR